MKKYKITIKHDLDEKEYTGIFEQEPYGVGVELEALEWYACELGTSINSLEIIKTVAL